MKPEYKSAQGNQKARKEAVQKFRADKNAQVKKNVEAKRGKR